MYYSSFQLNTYQAFKFNNNKLYNFFTPFENLTLQIYQKKQILPLNLFLLYANIILEGDFTKSDFQTIQMNYEKKFGEEYRESFLLIIPDNILDFLIKNNHFQPYIQFST